jgi:site-specific DNA-methyltransferase (adenine-specific)
LRDYGVDGQVGNETDFKEYVSKLIELYSEIQRVLKPTGTCFVNLGDTYNGTKQGNTETNKNPKLVTDSFKKEKVKTIQDKSLLMIPERFAIGMIDAGWILRNQIIWHKPNQMPSSAKDRFTVDFEKIFFFVKQPKGYYFEQQLEPAIGYDGRKDIEYKGGNKDVSIGKHQRWKTHKNIQDKGQQPNSMHLKRAAGIPDEVYFERNVRTVWSINTQPFPEAHFATYPEKLVKRMIEAGCPENGLVLDPFMGAGTTAVVAKKLNRNYTGFELNPKYKLIAENRLIKEVGLFL